MAGRWSTLIDGVVNNWEETGPMKFYVDGKEYDVPESYLRRAMLVRQALGMDATEAITDALTRWIRSGQDGSKVVLTYY